MTATAAITLQKRGGAAAAPADPNAPDGLLFRLSEGKAPGSEKPAPPTPSEKLSDADAEKLLARLPLPKSQPGDVVDFALREGSLPAPRAGQTAKLPFPPAPSVLTPPSIESGPLTVRRMTPEGDVPVADRISVTFSQPMVPVTSQEDAAAQVPVKLSPSFPAATGAGSTQTLVFEAGQGRRLPQATEYTLTVPAGVKSQSGNALSSASKLVFRTPAVQLLSHFPGDGEPQTRNPLIRMAFDQNIDEQAVLKTVRLKANGKEFGVRLATSAEVISSPERFWGSDVPRERTLALKAVETLPGETSFSVEIGPGTPSAEGPRKTDSVQSFGFATYGPLRMTASQCGWGDQVCRPDTPWHVDLTTPSTPRASIRRW